MALLSYLRSLTTTRIVLWCYLIWWLYAATRYFDPSPRLWLTSLGISLIMGTALYLSTAYGAPQKLRLDGWQVFRFFLMPFCVSSFAALVKDRGFVVVLHPSLHANLEAAGFCLAFYGLTRVVRVMPVFASQVRGATVSTDGQTLGK